MDIQINIWFKWFYVKRKSYSNKNSGFWNRIWILGAIWIRGIGWINFFNFLTNLVHVTILLTKSISIHSHDSVYHTRVCISEVAFCLFMIAEYWDAKLVTIFLISGITFWPTPTQQSKLNNFNVCLWDKRNEIFNPISTATEACWTLRETDCDLQHQRVTRTPKEKKR